MLSSRNPRGLFAFVATAALIILPVPSLGSESQSLYIQPSRSEQAYLTGNSFFVTCFLGEFGDRDQMMWRDHEGRPITETEGRIHVYRGRDDPGGVVSIQLVVEEVQMGDAGTYTCSSIADGKEVSVSFQLFVYKAISFQGTKDIQTATEGDDKAVIRCEADAYRKPEFSWQLNGRAIRDTNGNEKYSVDGNVLTIYNVKTTDAGNYTCKAFMGTRHLVSVQKKEIQFIVQYRPRFKDTTPDITYARVGSLAKITCDAEGEPTPSIQWLRGKEHIYMRDEFNIIGNVGSSTLNIDMRDHSYYDVYTCHAQNGLGVREKHIKLSEGGPPTTPRVSVIEAKKDTIVLHIDHSDDEYLNELGIDSFRVQYKTDDGTWETAPAQEYAVNSDRSPHYHLRNLNTNTSYVIRVSAKNAAGPSDFSQELYHRTQTMDYQRAPVNFAASSQLFSSTVVLLFPLLLLRQRT